MVKQLSTAKLNIKKRELRKLNSRIIRVTLIKVKAAKTRFRWFGYA